MDFRERKRLRTNHYFKYIHGRKLGKCYACNGSGYYDHNGSPKCAACNGTGKVRYSPEELEEIKM